MRAETTLYRSTKQTGFTLVELMIVMLIVGVFFAIFALTSAGSDNSAKAMAIIKASDDIGSSVSRLASSCGISTTVASNPLPDSGKSLLDVVMVGESEMAAAYQKCWKQASARPLMDIAQKAGTAYKVQGYDMALTGGGTAPFSFTFTKVPDEIVLLAAQKYTPDLTALTASDTTSPKIRYGTATGGARDLTVLVRP